MPVPAGAKNWNSGAQRSLADVLPQQADAVDEPSRAAIAIINEGLLHDDCTQLDGYGPDRFSAQVNGENALLQLSFGSSEAYTAWVQQLVDNAQSVTTWADIERDRMGVLDLPGGERLCVFLPTPGRYHLSFSLRKHNAAAWQIQDFVSLKTLDQRMLHFLQSCVAAHVNILFVGAMGSGKTSLLRSLAQFSIGDDEKIAVVEQVPELAIAKPLVCEYIYQPKVDGLGLADVLDYNLYNGLSRLIVGEVHLEGLTKMLETMILTEGSMSTYHAYSSEQAGERMKMGLQLENANVTSETAASYLRQAIELIVVLEKVDGARRVTQVTELDWRNSAGADRLGGADIFKYDRQKKAFRGVSIPDSRNRVAQKCDKYGISLPQQWFLEPDEVNRHLRG